MNYKRSVKDKSKLFRMIDVSESDRQKINVFKREGEVENMLPVNDFQIWEESATIRETVTYFKCSFLFAYLLRIRRETKLLRTHKFVRLF